MWILSTKSTKIIQDLQSEFKRRKPFRRTKGSVDSTLCKSVTLVSRRLGCCNSLFRSMSIFNHISNSVFSKLFLITNHRMIAHANPILKEIHWLPIKICCLFRTSFADLQAPKLFWSFFDSEVLLLQHQM